MVKRRRVLLDQHTLDGTPHDPNWSTVAEMLADKTGKRYWLYGGGTNSTAGVVESINRNINFDGILFADTGSERPNTIEFFPHFHDWLKKYGLRIETASKGESLYDYCINNQHVPDTRHRWCTRDFKTRPTSRICKPMRKMHKGVPGHKVYTMMGYAYDEPGRMGPQKEALHMPKLFPLVEWKITRKGCLDIIKAAGLPDPGKSGCFFCPFQKIGDWFNLYTKWPKYWELAKKMEIKSDDVKKRRYLIDQKLKPGVKPMYLEDMEVIFNKKISLLKMQQTIEGKGVVVQDSAYACGRFSCMS